MNRRFAVSLSLAVSGGCLALATSCRQDATTAPSSPPPSRTTTFDLSDSSAAAGATVAGTLVGHFPAGEQVLSVTARVRFDTTVVRFLGALSPSSGAQQAVNAANGVVRVAAISVSGFAPTASLAKLQFSVLRPGVRAAFSLTIDELHTTSGAVTSEVAAAAPLLNSTTSGAWPSRLTPPGEHEMDVDEREALFRAPRAYPFAYPPADAPARMARAAARLAARGRVPQSTAIASRLRAPTDGAVWQSLGPEGSASDAASFSSPNPPVYVGRVTSIALDPSGSGLYVGAASGGVWHASALGASWNPLTDSQCTLNTGVVAVDPVNPRIIYAGTGEYNIFSPGCGLLRSTDAGATWAALGAAAMVPPGNVGLCYSSIYIDSATAGGSSTTLLVGTTAGLYRSTNSGASWTQVLGGLVSAIVRRPDSANVLYAGSSQPFDFSQRAVYRSSDDGVTWTPLPPLPDGSTPLRFTLATSPAAPSKLFLVHPTTGDSILSFFKWDDDAATWSQTAFNSSNVIALGHQASYDETLAVDPSNANNIYVAGTFALRSTDGGATFVPMGAGVHVDWHSIVVDPRSPNTVYAGTDGGVYQSVDAGVTWTAYNTGLAITQFYNGLGVDSLGANIVAGTQDNGAQRYTSNPFWQILVTGDAGSAVMNPRDPSDAYVVLIDGSIWHFSGAKLVSTTRPGPAGRGQLVIDPTSPSTLYYADDHVYRSTNAGVSWQAISPALPRQSFGFVSAFAMAASDRKTMYAGTNDSYVQVSRDGGNTFTLSNTGLPNRSVTHVAIDGVDASHALLTMSGFGSGHVFETHDYGAHWTDISASLGDLPANSVLQLPLTGVILVGTDHGAYQTSDDGATWQPVGTGLPNVAVEDLAYAPGARTVIAATYGRGMFALELQGGPQILAGDANSDGSINAYDALLVARKVSGVAEPAVGASADANCDGRIDALDVTLILDAAVGLPTPGACVGTIR